MDTLDNDIKFVAGVGEARAKLLERELGIRTLGDMLSHYPFRYIDRTKVYRIAEITDDAPTLLQFRARVTGVAYAGTGRKRRFTAYVSDPTDRLVLEAALKALGEEERQVVLLHAASGLKHREIARDLGLPLSTVLSRYSRALKKLQRYLTEEGVHL